MKRQTTVLNKIFISHIFDKRIVSGTYKELLKLKCQNSLLKMHNSINPNYAIRE